MRPTGTASITGRITAVDSGRPLVRARVQLSSTDVPGLVAAVTDQEGRYTFANLPPGTYTLVASKPGFVSLAHGARSPQRPGGRVVLAQGQQARDIDVRLPRGGVVTGRIFDETGEPLVRAMVRAMRYQYQQGQRHLVQSGSGESDDRGVYRIFGLSPGTYLVTAAARMEMPSSSDGQPVDPSVVQTYAPTYFPGVTSLADAAPVVLGSQLEASGLDFMLQVVSTVRVSGTVTAEAGAAQNPFVIVMTDEGPGASAGTSYAASVKDDGSFSIGNVPPGRYLAIARAMVTPAPGERQVQMVTTQAFALGSQDFTGLNLVLSAGGAITGSIVVQSAMSQQIDLTRVRVSVSPPSPIPFVGGANARVSSGGGFQIPNVVPGPQVVNVSGLPKPWTLKGVFLNGRDITDRQIDVRNGMTTTGVEVVLSDRATEVMGTVLDGQSKPVADCYVLAFSADTADWRPRSRAVQGVRPDHSGAFHVLSLPPGDYYVIALADIEPGSWYEPALLEQLRKSAVKISLAEGETKAQELRVLGDAG
ncbi:MAG TPA: carboxypeptidase-like regulatory domain-containing protein [Vicinamibacterales bacterium]